jgi:hypothetical protein
MEVGAPVKWIQLALGANALTPRHDHLKAGFWARGSFPPTALLVYPNTAVSCSDRTKLWCFLPVGEPGPGSLR